MQVESFLSCVPSFELSHHSRQALSWKTLLQCQCCFVVPHDIFVHFVSDVHTKEETEFFTQLKIAVELGLPNDSEQPILTFRFGRTDKAQRYVVDHTKIEKTLLSPTSEELDSCGKPPFLRIQFSSFAIQLYHAVEEGPDDAWKTSYKTLRAAMDTLIFSFSSRPFPPPWLERLDPAPGSQRDLSLQNLRTMNENWMRLITRISHATLPPSGQLSDWEIADIQESIVHEWQGLKIPPSVHAIVSRQADKEHEQLRALTVRALDSFWSKPREAQLSGKPTSKEHTLSPEEFGELCSVLEQDMEEFERALLSDLLP